MSHAYHDSLPGFHPDQVLFDGCPECEHRGSDPLVALANLDAHNFRRAWLRAADWQATTPPSGKHPEAISEAETQLLRTLWAVQVRFEGIWSLGTLPEGTR